MELEGRKELADTRKSDCLWNVPTVSLRLAVLNVFQGFFGPKMAVFGRKMQFFETEVRHLRIPFRAAIVEFTAQTLCDCTSHPEVSSTKILPESEAPRRNSDFEAFRACCLLLACLLACLLAAAKPVRSTLDPKEGYKTKTGSTSSVTLTLTLTVTLTWSFSYC